MLKTEKSSQYTKHTMLQQVITNVPPNPPPNPNPPTAPPPPTTASTVWPMSLQALQSSPTWQRAVEVVVGVEVLGQDARLSKGMGKATLRNLPLVEASFGASKRSIC